VKESEGERRRAKESEGERKRAKESEGERRRVKESEKERRRAERTDLLGRFKTLYLLTFKNTPAKMKNSWDHPSCAECF